MRMGAPAADARLAKCLDIADEVVDLRARQHEIRHLTVRVRQECVKLVGCHSAARDCAEARGTSAQTLDPCDSCSARQLGLGADGRQQNRRDVLR